MSPMTSAWSLSPVIMVWLPPVGMLFYDGLHAGNPGAGEVDDVRGALLYRAQLVHGYPVRADGDAPVRDVFKGVDRAQSPAVEDVDGLGIVDQRPVNVQVFVRLN